MKLRLKEVCVLLCFGCHCQGFNYDDLSTKSCNGPSEFSNISCALPHDGPTGNSNMNQIWNENQNIINNLSPNKDCRGKECLRIFKKFKSEPENLKIAIERPRGNALYENLHIMYFVLISVIITYKHITSKRSPNTKTQNFRDPREATDDLNAIFDTINVGVIATDNHMRITFINSTAADMCGWNADRAIGRPVDNVARLVHNRKECDDTKEGQTQEDGTVMLQSLDGRHIDVRQSVTPLTVHNEVTGVVMLLQDMTISREMIKKLSHSASHDALTGLPNRASFERRLHNAVINSIEYSTHHALVFLDLDGFKKVNDTCGHAAGDALLVQVSKLMQRELRCGDFLARLGGDEFGIILFDCGLQQGKFLVENLLSKVKGHVFRWEGKESRVGASAGVSGISDDTRCVGELMARVDAACYSAKSRGKGQAFVFKQDTRVSTVKCR